MSEKIRIAVVAGGLTNGGVESVVYNYASHMDGEKYEWHYISYDTPDPKVQKKFEALGFHVHPVTKKYENLIKSCREVSTIFKENRIQIVHSHMTLMSFVTNILGQMAGAKMRISHSHLAQHPTGIKRFVYFIFKKLSTWSATDYFACGEEAGRYLFGDRLVDQGKVYILNNAQDYKRYQPDAQKREKVRTEWKMSDKIVIGHVGRFAEQKNHVFLLKIYAEYLKQNENSVLFLVGDGPLMDDVRAQAKELKIEDHVIFAGTTDRMDAYYMAMDVFLFPSLYEGLSVAALEAQASGLPVVSSDTVAKETALNEQSMRFLSLDAPVSSWAKAVEDCTIDAESRQERVKQALEDLKERHLYIDEEAKKLDRFYHRVLENRK